MIKLLLVIPTLDRSGAEKQFTLLAERLPRDEFDIRVVTLVRGGPYAKRLEAAGIPVDVLGKRWKFDPMTLWRLKGLVRDWQPDVVNSWMFTANSYTRLVTGREPRPRVVVSERCVDTWKSGWQTWLDRRQIDRTAMLVGNSPAVVDFYRDLGYPKERTVCVSNGIDLPNESATTVDRPAILRDLKIPESAHLVGYVGRLARQKRVGDLVWAMQLLRQLDEKAHLIVVGEGPERNKLEKLSEHYGCDHVIRFVGHREDVPRLLGAIDVFWLASDFEGQSNSVMEAMAAGLPVVASDIPPNRELVVDGETGYIAPVGDATAFAQWTDRLFSDSERRQAMGAAGAERMREQFSVEAMVDGYANVYRRVLED